MDDSSLLRKFARYCLSNVIGMLALSCYILADTFFVAKGMGSDGLTALNLAIPVYSFIHGGGLMLGMGGGTKYSILKCQKGKNASAPFTHALCMWGALSGIFFFCGVFFSAQIAAAFHAEGEIFVMCRTYLRVILLFSPAFMLNNLLLCFVRNDDAPTLAMAAMVSGSLSNIVLDYLFIFPLGMGMFGAVLATGLAPMISLCVLSCHFLKRKHGFHLVRVRVRGRMLLSICAIGLPSLVSEVSAGVVMIVFNLIILSLAGNVGVAAYAVVANLSLVVFAIYAGLAQGTQPLLSRYYGQGDRGKVAAVLRYGMCAVSASSAVIYAAIFFGADKIAAIFNNEANPVLQAMATGAMRLYFCGCVCVGLNVLLAGYFAATNAPRPAHTVSLLRGLVLIVPVSFLLAHFGGMTGLWLALPLTELAVCAGACIFLHRRADP